VNDIKTSGGPLFGMAIAIAALLILLLV